MKKIKNVFSTIVIYAVLIIIFLVVVVLYSKDKICDIFRKEKKCKGFWSYMDFLDFEDPYDCYYEE